jgi:Transposase, Mutator family
VATGITADGGREVLGLDVGDSEDEVFWRGFLTVCRAETLRTACERLLCDRGRRSRSWSFVCSTSPPLECSAGYPGWREASPRCSPS